MGAGGRRDLCALKILIEGDGNNQETHKEKTKHGRCIIHRSADGRGDANSGGLICKKQILIFLHSFYLEFFSNQFFSRRTDF